MDAPLLEAAGIAKQYGDAPVLRGVSVTLHPGEMLAIMGPSGCGKSTLLHILGLLLPPDAGSYTCCGQDLLRLDHHGQALFRRTCFGFVLQSCNMFSFTTAEENVEYPLIYAGVPRAERRGRVREALAS